MEKRLEKLKKKQEEIELEIDSLEKNIEINKIKEYEYLVGSVYCTVYFEQYYIKSIDSIIINEDEDIIYVNTIKLTYSDIEGDDKYYDYQLKNDEMLSIFEYELLEHKENINMDTTKFMNDVEKFYSYMKNQIK